MGGASFLAGLALWLTSLERARRSRYALFYAAHQAGWWGFLVAGMMHTTQMLW